MGDRRTAGDVAHLAAVLGPAVEHAGVGERVPELARVPAPLRWLARLGVRAVYAAASPLTRRQRAVNQSLVEAVRLLGRQSPASPAGPDGWAADAADAAGGVGPRSFTAAVRGDDSLMLWPERVLLYAAVFGLRPQRVLEVGTFRGASAAVIVAALDDIGAGTLVCVDPLPEVAPDRWAGLAHRAQLVAERSPDALLTAERLAGGRFDFALIDGDHSRAGVRRDVEGALPVLADRAYLLFHDAANADVAAGVADAVAAHPRHLTDIGMLSTLRIEEAERPGVFWGGLWMVRFDRPAC